MVSSSASIFGFPADVIALAALASALLLFGISGGRKFSIPFLLSLYVAQTVVATLPSLGTFFLRVGATLPDQVRPVAFLLALVMGTWLLAGTAVTSIFRFSLRGVRVWWQVAAASILGTGLFAALFFPLLPSGVFAPSALVRQWFLADPLPLLWALAPIAFFALLKAREE